jgi:4-amino-4-deoxy-L-arabinose transferase-like glycosyltransferase
MARFRGCGVRKAGAVSLTSPTASAKSHAMPRPQPASLTTSFERLIARWPGHSNERGVVVLLAIFVIAWTAFHTITYAAVGLHPDLTEVYDWGRHPLVGYYKHPPLSALVTALWFSIVPAADWAFNLLGLVNAAVGLYFADRIARRYVSDDKRLVVLLLLMLTPFYQFFGQKFNANSILLSTWPLAVYCFLRAFESRTVMWSLAAGAAAALAMLGKYYSIYLVGGIVIAALLHPGRARYLKSPSPWISIGIGLLALAPHVEWLVRTGFQPFGYAYVVHGNPSFGPIIVGIAGYLAGALGYIALPFTAYLLMARPSRRRLAASLWPSNPDRRMLAVMFYSFLLLPPLSAPFLGVVLTSLWTMPIWFLLPVILLAAPAVKVPRRAVARTAGALLVVTAVAVVIAAPVLAWINFNRPSNDDRVYYRQLSDVVTLTWHARVGRRLAIVLGETRLASAIEFYSHDHPDSAPDFNLPLAPWVTPARLAREGWAAACRADDAGCVARVAAASAQQPLARRSEVEIVPTFLGYGGAPARFVIVIVPPYGVADLSSLSP